METKSIIGLIIGFLVGAIILASFVPIFMNVQNDSGDSVTLTNNSAIVLREIQEGDVLKLTRTIDEGGTATNVWTLNDVEVTSLGGSTLEWNVGLISDAWYLQITTNSTVSATAYKMNVTDPANGQVAIGGSDIGTSVSTFTVADGNITFTSRSGTQQAIPYTWGYVVCPKEEGQYYSAETNGLGICKTADDLILCGAYTSGDLDTMYAYHDGTTYTGNNTYSMSIDTPLTLHSGTSDIYDISVSVTMSDGVDTEDFTPYRIFLPYEVTGHATKGVMFDLFGLLPLIAGVGLLMSAVVYFLRRY